MGRYAFARSWGREDERLATLERQLDPVSRAAIGQLGLAAGSRCWEAGAGSGSMAAWLAGRLDDALAALNDQTRTIIGAPIVTAWGQRTS